MSNLLPQENKEALKKDYRLRVLIVSLALFLVLVVVFIILLVPSYALFVNRSKSVVSQLDQLKNEEESLEAKEYVAKVSETAQQIRILKPGDDTEERRLADKIEIILSNKPGGVFITSMISRDGKTFEIRGTTNGRESILDFAKNLEENPLVTYIEAPISNLLLNEDSQFVITIVLE